jgi:PAS domain S-box-containing protein
MALETRGDLLERNRGLEERLCEAEETLRALGSGEVDAVVVSGPDGDRVYSLKGADEAYRMMVEQMAEGALTLALDGLILFSNDQFASILGIPLEHVIGASIHDFIAPEDASMLSAVLAASAGSRAEVRLKRGPSTLVPAYVSSNRLAFDETECVCLIVTELSEQKRNREIVAAERLARSILDQTAGAILVVNPAGKIIRASRAAEQMVNGTVLLHKFDDLFCLRSDSGTKECNLEAILLLVKQCGRVAGVEATARMPDGVTLDVMLSASLLTGASSECLGCIVLLHDVSGLKRAEQAVRHLSEQRGLVLEAARLGSWDYQFESGEVILDERCRAMFGISDGDEIDYGSAIARIHEDDRVAVEEAAERAIAGDNGGAFHREYRLVWPDHSVHWVASHG